MTPVRSDLSPSMSVPWRPLRPALAAAIILAVDAALMLALNLPGQLSYDSVFQLSQARAGVYNAWHPPVMAWLLGLADAVSPGTPLFVVGDALLIFGSLVSLALLAPRSAWAAVVVSLAWAASPLLLLYPGIVWKDVLFAAATVSGFTCLAHAGLRWRSPWTRRGLVAASLLLVSLAVLARQTGVVVLPFAAAALGWMAASGSGSGRWSGWKAGLVQAIAYAATSVAIVAGSSAALATRSDGEPSRQYQIEDLQTYDLVSALKLDPRLQYQVLAARDPRLERLIRTDGLKAYSPYRIDPLVALTELTSARQANAEAIGAQWKALVLGHPLLYLRVRAKAFYWVTLTPQLDQCVPAYVGVDGAPMQMRSLGLAPRDRPQDEAIEAYAHLFVGTPVLSHAAYGALALVALALLLRRRRGPDIAMAAMLLAAIAFSSTFFLISVACDYRYLYVLDLSVMAAALYLAATHGWSPWRLRRAPA